MPKKMYVGAIGKNIFHDKQNNGKTSLGVTYSYNKETQEYTLNGTTTARGDLLLGSGIMLNWKPGEKYTVTIIQTGGKATLGEGSGITYSFSIFNNNNSKYLRSGNLYLTEFPGTVSFTGNAVAESTEGSGYKLYLQLWWAGTTFENYKFKVQIEKGSQATEYEKYNPNTPRQVNKMYISVDGVARRVKKGYVSDNGILKLFFEEVEDG